MANYNLVNKQGTYYVEGLSDDWSETPDTLLVVYGAGDCDTVSEPGELMHRALYDTYQTSEGLKDGDTFSLDGKVVYACSGVHVVEAEAAAS